MNLEINQNIHIILAVASFLLGGTIGSFLNVCVHRLPKGLSVVTPRSRCPKCEKEIAWYDNIPMLSWLILGAKCRNCNEPISWQYPLVEAITGLLFLLVYLRFGLTVAAPIYMILSASLVLVTFIDLTDWTIPNEVTFPGMPLGIGCALLGMVIPGSGLRLDSPVMAIAGLALGGGILYTLDKLSLLLLKKPGMGFGDVKLVAMLGAFFGPWGVLLTIVTASFIGAAVGLTMMSVQRSRGKEKGEGNYLPFGPYLALGGLIVMFSGQEIIDLYLSYILAPGALT